MKVLIGITGVIAGSVVAFSTVHSSTPDGVTPALENVCDRYTGAAFGLCNAYCEAMDCDDDPRADQEACNKVKQKFTARTRQPLPCGTCPAGFVEPGAGVFFECTSRLDSTLPDDGICISTGAVNSVLVCTTAGCKTTSCSWWVKGGQLGE